MEKRIGQFLFVCIKKLNFNRPLNFFAATIVIFMCFCSSITQAENTLPVSPLEKSAGSPPKVSQQQTVSSTAEEIASATTTLIYFPLKAAFAVGGGIVGGFAYLLTGGDDIAAQNIWQTTMKGDYRITPENLSGEKPLNFFGVPEKNSEDSTPIQ